MCSMYLTIGKLQQIEMQVQNYNMLFWICILGVVLFGGVTVFLFFYFQIFDVFMELTGIRKRQEIGKMHKKRTRVSEDRKKAGTKRYVQNRREEIPLEKTESMDATVVLSENDYIDVGETTVLEAPTELVIEKELSSMGSEETL